jgi:4-amino-4-deoxy-L-arabinose transferase-like glycosyltransferase
VRPIEPPILDYLSMLEFRVTGENFWFPRLLSSLCWVIGGVFLYRIAVRLMAPGGAVVALALYLTWPFGAWFSRHFMPDSLMILWLLAAVLAVIRYFERPSRPRFAAAAGVAAVATLIKPGVAFVYLVAVFGAVAVAAGGRHALRRWGPAFVLFSGIAALPAVVYYVIGTKVADFIWFGASTARLTPENVLRASFWNGWWDAVSYLLRYPQTQELLALAPLVAAAAGIAVAGRGLPRAVLIGLSLGYLAFAVTFAGYVSANPYYSLPLIPLLALCIGTLVSAVAAPLRRVAPGVAYVLFACVAAVVGVAAYKSYAVMRVPIPATAIPDYRRIGELTHHTTKAIVVDNELRTPSMYWGWIGAEAWDLAEDEPPPSIHPERADFLVVVGLWQLDTSSGLRRFVRGLPIVGSTSRYAVYDLRGDGSTRLRRARRLRDRDVGSSGPLRRADVFALPVGPQPATGDARAT